MRAPNSMSAPVTVRLIRATSQARFGVPREPVADPVEQDGWNPALKSRPHVSRQRERSRILMNSLWAGSRASVANGPCGSCSSRWATRCSAVIRISSLRAA